MSIENNGKKQKHVLTQRTTKMLIVIALLSLVLFHPVSNEFIQAAKSPLFLSAIQQQRREIDGIKNVNAFLEHSWKSRKQLLNKSSALLWSARDFEPFFSLFNTSLDRVKNESDTEALLKIYKNETRVLVWASRLCKAAHNFNITGRQKYHVLFTHFNENWGGLSGQVENRTVAWGTLEGTLGECSLEDVMAYLNDEHVLGVITTQFQQIDHPKVHSIPLGLSMGSVSFLESVFRKGSDNDPPSIHNKTQLVMLNSNFDSPNRVPQYEIIKQLPFPTGSLNNTYGQKNQQSYFEELMRSKFVFSPSGIGWDCYRNWEALSFGTIPIIEHYNRSDGWHRTFKDLPVLWVPSFHVVTPQLLEMEYLRLAKKWKTYNYEKLTKLWWEKFIFSLSTVNQKEEEHLPPTRGFTTREGEDHSLDALLPQLSICNVSKFEFNNSKFLLTSRMSHTPKRKNNGLKLGYGPFLPKSGSTSSVKMLKKLGVEAGPSDDTVFTDHTFFTFLRHPLDRALAGYHQIEVFYHLGWIDAPIRKYNLQWWKTSCFNTTYGEGMETTFRCTGNVTMQHTKERLLRFNHFLDEIAMIGFYDEHITPLTYLIESSPVTHQAVKKPLVFDLQNFDVVKDVFTNLNAFAESRKLQDFDTAMAVFRNEVMANATTESNTRRNRLKSSPREMVRPKNKEAEKEGMHWIISQEDLVEWVNNSVPGASEALSKLCHMYRQDIECFSSYESSCCDEYLSPR